MEAQLSAILDSSDLASVEFDLDMLPEIPVCCLYQVQRARIGRVSAIAHSRLRPNDLVFSG